MKDNITNNIFSEEEVEKLKLWQEDIHVHPYTCPGNNNCVDRKLIPTINGWICSCREYKQDWAHDFSKK